MRGAVKRGRETLSLIRLGYGTLRERGVAPFAREASTFALSKVDEALLFNVPLYHDIRERYHTHKLAYEMDDHEAPLNPYKIEWVDPDEITEFTRREVRPEKSCGIVEDGDWDRRDHFVYSEDYGKKYWHDRVRDGIYFEDSLFYRAFEAHFERDVDWRDTEYFDAALEAFEMGEKISNGYTTEEELISDFDRTDELYHEIRTNGYKTRDEIEGELDFDGGPTTFEELKKSEIAVDIARDGKLLFASSGKHRLAIAKVLDLDTVPVVFICRHEEWLDHREYVYRNGLRVSHPDFSEFQGE